MRTIITRPNKTGLAAVVLLKYRFPNVDWKVTYTDIPMRYVYLLDRNTATASEVTYFIGFAPASLPKKIIRDRVANGASIYVIGKDKKLEDLNVRLVSNPDKEIKFKDYISHGKKEDLISLLLKEANEGIKGGHNG